MNSLTSVPSSESSSLVDIAERWYQNHQAIPTQCRIPARRISSVDFQKHPLPLEIEWVRQEHSGFFTLLSGMEDDLKRAQAFHHYTLARFWANEDPEQRPEEKERARRGYIALLRGWGYDSNSTAGAVLKGWAEQRFGLRPIWHGHLLGYDEEEQDISYLGARMRGYLTGIGMQLDLLYSYCQDEMRRRHSSTEHLTLYRGCYDPQQHVIRKDKHGEIVEFNAISSFTDDREVAWEFGSTVWRVLVPLSKIVLAPDILPPGYLHGEREYLVLGGEYRVEPLLY